LQSEIKKILESPEFLEGVRRKLLEERGRWQQEARAMLQKYYPEHLGHNAGELEEGNWEYFDALFVSYEIVCGCGARLTVTREML